MFRRSLALFACAALALSLTFNSPTHAGDSNGPGVEPTPTPCSGNELCPVGDGADSAEDDPDADWLSALVNSIDLGFSLIP